MSQEETMKDTKNSKERGKDAHDHGIEKRSTMIILSIMLNILEIINSMRINTDTLNAERMTTMTNNFK